MTPTTTAASHDEAVDSTLEDQDARLPRRNARLFGLFRRYVRSYVSRHFHAVRIDRDGPLPELAPGPVVVALNHPSWWDPMIGLVLTGELPESRAHYAPIDAVGLAQYPFLERLGFYGVELGTPRGGLRFLRRSLAILSRPDSVLWITVQGHFVDPRERPIRIKAGVGTSLIARATGRSCRSRSSTPSGTIGSRNRSSDSGVRSRSGGLRKAPPNPGRPGWSRLSRRLRICWASGRDAGIRISS